MKKLSIYCVVFVSNLAWVSTAHAVDTAVIDRTVTESINVVHSLEGSGAKSFDAYYNSATGRVENNVTFVGQQWVLFYFNKCEAIGMVCDHATALLAKWRRGKSMRN